MAISAQVEEAAKVVTDQVEQREEVTQQINPIHRQLSLDLKQEQSRLAGMKSRLAALAWPLGWTNRQLTVGWLPDGIRRQYGFDWTARDERRSAAILRWLRVARKALPAPLALWPEARSVFILTMSYAPEEDPMHALADSSIGVVSVYARRSDYHDVMKGKLKFQGDLNLAMKMTQMFKVAG